MGVGGEGSRAVIRGKEVEMSVLDGQVNCDVRGWRGFGFQGFPVRGRGLGARGMGRRRGSWVLETARSCPYLLRGRGLGVRCG